jgi:hypothetical protein
VPQDELAGVLRVAGPAASEAIRAMPDPVSATLWLSFMYATCITDTVNCKLTTTDLNVPVDGPLPGVAFLPPKAPALGPPTTAALPSSAGQPFTSDEEGFRYGLLLMQPDQASWEESAWTENTPGPPEWGARERAALDMAFAELGSKAPGEALADDLDPAPGP